MDCLAAKLFPNSSFSDAVFVTLFRAAVGTAVSGVRKLLRTGRVPTSLTVLYWRWLTVSSVFTGRSARTNYSYSVSTPPPFPISPVHNNNNRVTYRALSETQSALQFEEKHAMRRIPVIIQTNGIQAYKTYEN